MPARARGAFGDEVVVVVWRAKPAEDPNATRHDTMRGEICEHELELVDERLLKHDVLRPLISLVVRQKLGQHEMLRESQSGVRLRHLDEAVGIEVLATHHPSLRRPATEPVPFQRLATLLSEWPHNDERERSLRSVCVDLMDAGRSN